MKREELLVIRLSSLGDVAMMVPVFLSFHKAYPNIDIRLISRERFKPIFNGLSFVSFEAIDKGRTTISLIQLIRFAIQLPLTNVAKVLDLHSVLRTKILSFVFGFKGAEISKVKKGRADKMRLIQMKGRNIYQLKTSVERYAQVFQEAGFNIDLKNEAFLEKSNCLPHDKKWIGIAPFAKHFSKEYDLSLMREVIEKLAEIPNMKIFLFGNGSRELEIAKNIAKDIDQVEILIGKLSFVEELKQISNLDLMISMDSGNGHLAVNYGVPVITLWGATHPYMGFAPHAQPRENHLFPDKNKFPNLPVSIYGNCNNKSYERAIDSIKPMDIVAKAKVILNISN